MDEVRLIDAELLKTNIAQIAKCCAKSDKQKALVGRILFMIDNMPTINVEPVKHGRWKHSETEGLPTNRFVCSECYGLTIVSTYRNRCMFNYCPHCGAKMDGGEQDE